MTAAYSNPLESKSENSTASATRQTLNLMNEAIVPPVAAQKISVAEVELAVRVARHALVAATIDDLVEMGLLETFVDDHRITRYRPTGGRIA